MHGIGLRKMRERLGELDGTLKIVSHGMATTARERWRKKKSPGISADERAEPSEAD